MLVLCACAQAQIHDHYAGQMAHSFTKLCNIYIYIYISLAKLKKILDFVINSLNFLSRVRCERLGMFLVATRMRESNSGESML